MTEETLGRALKCLEPLGPRLVVVGGTAQRLFLEHELARDPGFEPLTTEDVDVAASLELQASRDEELARLLEAAGFSEELEGAHDEPTYRWRIQGDGAYLQFLAPRLGDGERRQGRSLHLVRISGIHAERLRHVDILLHRPWRVALSIDEIEGHLWVVNPAAYLVQKLLVLEHRREQHKAAKDILYAFDTLAIFADKLDDLGSRIEELLPALRPATRRRLASVAGKRCFRETDLSRDAAVIAAEQRARPPSSRQIVAACRDGLPRVLKGLLPGPHVSDEGHR